MAVANEMFDDESILSEFCIEIRLKNAFLVILSEFIVIVQQ